MANSTRPSSPPARTDQVLHGLLIGGGVWWEQDVDVDARDEDGKTPAFVAVAENNVRERAATTPPLCEAGGSAGTHRLNDPCVCWL